MAGVPGMHFRASLSPAYAEAVRARIRAAGICKHLEQHVLGKIEMSASQVTAALGLLRKVVPDLSATQIVGRNGGPIEVEQITDEMEIARRIVFALSAADNAIAKAKESEHA